MSLDPVLYRTALVDESGMMSREWVRFFSGLGTAATANTTAFDPAGTAASLSLLKSNNLSDLANLAIARANLGLSSAATQALTAFLLAANNLSDLTNLVIARSNLGLGSVATHAAAEFLLTANNLSDLANAATARTNLLGSWATWTPTMSANGAMTFTGVTVNDAQYLQLGPICHFKLDVSGTVGGTPNTTVIAAVPVALAGNTSAISGLLVSNGAGLAFQAIPAYVAAGGISFELPSAANYVAGVTRIQASGSYRII